MADNQGLVTTMAKRNEYTTPYPNSTLQPDRDLIEEIHTTYQYLNIAKGHQDSDTRYDELSIPAQFNVDADRLAEEYLETDPHKRRVSPLVPAARRLLHIPTETVHGHYTEKVREAASLPDLFLYLRQKYNWTQQALQTYSGNGLNLPRIIIPTRITT